MRKWLVASSVLVLAASARGQVKVMDSDDVIRLVSGEEIAGKVIGSGLKAVVIVVKGEDDALVERAIPREQVESVTRGDFSPTMKSYDVETIRGMKVVTGESEGEEESSEPEGPPKKKAPPARAKGGGKRPAGKGGAAAPAGVTKEQLEKLMKTNPGIERMVKAAGGPDKAMALLKQHGGNPQMMKLLQEFLKSGKLPAGLPGR